MRHVVVVGAGPAGARCAERLAQGGLRVTLIGDEPVLPYNRVALSQYLAGYIEAATLVTHDAARLATLGVEFRRGSEVTAIDREARRAAVDGDWIAYDALVVATGATAFRLPLPGAGLDGVVMYRSLSDVRRMLAAAERGGDAVVIGGGLLGLEAAAGLMRRGMRVTVLHVADRLMERQLDSGAARMLAARLAEQGIAVRLGAGTQALEGDLHVQAVRLSDGTRVPAELVVMAVGIRPNVALAKAAGLAVERGIIVDDAMRSSDPVIFAVGECAQHFGTCCGLLAPALAQAEVAARVLIGEAATYRPVSADATALKVAGAGVWSAGSIEAADAEAITLDDAQAGEYRRLLLQDGRLIGATLFGETADAPWYLDLIRSAAPVQDMRQALIFGPAFCAMPDQATRSAP